MSSRIFSTLPSSMPSDLANSASTSGRCAHSSLLQGDGELGGLTGHVLAMVVLRERQREGLALADFQADGGGFEFRQHAAFAQHEGVVFGLAAVELDAVDLADEVDGHAVAVGGHGFAAVAVLACLTLGVVVHALLAQDVDGLVDFGVADVGLDGLDFDAFQGRQADFRIDFEGGVEAQHAFRRFLLRFDFRHAGNAQLGFGGGIVERLADAVVQDIGFDLVAVLSGDHLHRHLARTEARCACGLGLLLEAFFDFRTYVAQRKGERQAALEFTQVFDCSCHYKNRPKK
jgi:hypothetical protein